MQGDAEQRLKVERPIGMAVACGDEHWASAERRA